MSTPLDLIRGWMRIEFKLATLSILIQGWMRIEFKLVTLTTV